MSKSGMMVGVVVACTLVLASAPRPVVAQDRPDLLEKNNSFVLPHAGGVDYNDVQLTDVAIGVFSGANHRQSFRVSHEFPGVDSLQFRMYEPEKVARSTTGATLQQSNYLFARILLPAPPTPYNTFSAYGVVTGCKGKAQIKNTNETKYSFSCSSADDVMNQLAVPAGLRSYITGLFGTKFQVKNSGTMP